MLYSSKQARDGALSIGVAAGYDRLDRVLSEHTTRR